MANDVRDVMDAADFFEPRLALAFIRAMMKLRDGVSVHDLGNHMARHIGQDFVTVAQIEKALSTVATVSKNSFAHGRMLGKRKIARAKRN